MVVKKAVYIVLAYTMDGHKDILGMYVGENESSKYWAMVLNDLKNRGLKDALIFSTDNPPGFSQAITAVYPKAEIQKCKIYQIGSPSRYVNHKDRRELMNDLKTIYKANTEEIALVQLDHFEEKWHKKYPSCVNSWKSNWAELSTF